ncbi:MAG: hypothetical protein AB8G99_01595 [Planctomycetaceae bacterium]
MPQGLESAKYFRPDEIIISDPRRQERTPSSIERINKMIGLTLCPLALVIGVVWFCQQRREYVAKVKERKAEHAKRDYLAEYHAERRRRTIYVSLEEYNEIQSERIRNFQRRKNQR